MEGTVIEDGVTEKRTFTGIVSFTEKDGKLVSLVALNEESSEKLGSSDYRQSYAYKAEYTYELAYAFDQAGYDDVEVNVPADVEVQDDYCKSFNVVINGVENDEVYAYGGETVRDAMTYAVENALDDFSDGEYGVNVVWYKDEACTQEINAETITEEEYYEIDTLYGKAILEEGYAFVIWKDTYKLARDLPKAYEIAFDVFFLRDKETSYLYFVGAGEVFFDERGVANADEVYLNGAVTMADSFTAKSGETYTVEYCEVLDKDYFNIFN